MTITATTWAFPPKRMDVTLPGIGDQRCIAATAVLCSVFGGAVLKLPRSRETGICCCCRDDHGDGSDC